MLGLGAGLAARTGSASPLCSCSAANIIDLARRVTNDPRFCSLLSFSSPPPGAESAVEGSSAQGARAQAQRSGTERAE